MLPIFKYLLNRVHEQLERGQSLLTIDHDPALDCCRREIRLLKHHGTHEVRLGRSFVDDQPRQFLNVIP